MRTAIRDAHRESSRRYRMALVLGASLAAAAVLLSVTLGPAEVSRRDYWAALTQYDDAVDGQFVVRQMRFPRAIVAAMVGGSLATAGALMQGVTQNPLASPSIMGLSSGGTLCLLVGILMNPRLDYSQSVALSFGGALLGYVVVCAVALLSRGGVTPTAFALAGAVVSAVFAAITHGLTICFGLHDELLYWTVGGISHVTWPQVCFLAPLCVTGLGLAIVLAPTVNILSLGKEVAAGLGQRMTRIRMAVAFAVLILTAGAIAVSGPVGFVGLMVPHVSRKFAGVDYRRILPLAITFGALLTMLADCAGRLFPGGRDLPLGMFTSFIGAPFFVYLARRSKVSAAMDG